MTQKHRYAKTQGRTVRCTSTPAVADRLLPCTVRRYKKSVNSAKNFLITQFGLSTFTWTGAAYEARTFNFYLFPRPYEDVDRRFLCQASSMEFLAKQVRWQAGRRPARCQLEAC